jgi:hypothetical protein
MSETGQVYINPDFYKKIPGLRGKFQIPSTKHQKPNKFQIPKFKKPPNDNLMTTLRPI